MPRGRDRQAQSRRKPWQPPLASPNPAPARPLCSCSPPAWFSATCRVWRAAVAGDRGGGGGFPNWDGGRARVQTGEFPKPNLIKGPRVFAIHVNFTCHAIGCDRGSAPNEGREKYYSMIRHVDDPSCNAKCRCFLGACMPTCSSAGWRPQDHTTLATLSRNIRTAWVKW